MKVLPHAPRRLWIAILVIALMLAFPLWFPAMERIIDPRRERAELAEAEERRQRAGGVPYVTARGERGRSVVYTPSGATEHDAFLRTLTWIYRVLALVLVARLLVDLRRERRQTT